jgi:hypothetical protein
MTQLSLILIALGMIIGVTKPQRLRSWALWTMFGPVLMGVGFALLKQTFFELSFLQQMAFAGFTAIVAAFWVGRICIPASVREDLLSHLLYDLIKGGLSLPFRVLRWSVNAWK